MTIKVRLSTGKVVKFSQHEGWHVERDLGDLVVRWFREGIRTDRVHVYPPGAWREVWVE